MSRKDYTELPSGNYLPTKPMDKLSAKLQICTSWQSGLEGKLLTIIDGCFQDREQRDAVKSMIRSVVRDHYEDTNTSIIRTLLAFTQVYEGNSIELFKNDGSITPIDSDVDFFTKN